MSFSMPRPAVSAPTAQLPDFIAADTVRKPDVAAQKASTFDALLSQHRAQAKPAAAKTDTSASEPRKARTDAADKPHKSTDKPAAARADDKTAARAAPQADDSKPAATASATAATGDAKRTDAQPADQATADVSAETTVTAAADAAQASDATVQADASNQTQAELASSDAATTAAALAAQASAQLQVQTQSQTEAPAQAADADTQLAALLPQARPAPKAPPQVAPDAVDDAAPADETKAAEAPSDAVFAALMAQAAPAQNPASPAAPAKTGKAVPSATDKPAAALAEPTLQPGAPSEKAAEMQVKLASGQDPVSADASGDPKPSPLVAGESHDGTPVKVQPLPIQLTPQPLTPELAANLQAVQHPQDGTGTGSAFSLQAAPADVAGSYSATGAQTASATTLSKSAIDNMGAMGLQIAKKLSEGVTKFAIELHPADLGKVDVALNIGRDGKTTAHLRFDSPVTAATFSAHEGELRQQLANAGLTLDDGALSFSSRDGSGDASQGFAQMFQGQEQAAHGQAARALKAAGAQADQIDADTALNAALAEFNNRSANSTLALNLVV